jgi:hypothetical protein
VIVIDYVTGIVMSCLLLFYFYEFWISIKKMKSHSLLVLGLGNVANSSTSWLFFEKLPLLMLLDTRHSNNKITDNDMTIINLAFYLVSKNSLIGMLFILSVVFMRNSLWCACNPISATFTPRKLSSPITNV